MDNRYIGVFDSGLGGLTVVKQLMESMPNENIVYFGDTGRVPYGTRSNDTIIKYVRGDIRFLNTFDIKMIIVACGTASAVALPIIKDENETQIIGVVEPTVKAALSATGNGNIGVIGTNSTIRSGAYEKLIGANPDVHIFSVPCPLFVPLVENGHTNSKAAYLIAREYLEPMVSANIDTLILGCTHYPLLKDIISDIMGDKVKLIEPGIQTAAYVKELLDSKNALSECKNNQQYLYYVSDDVDSFIRLGGLFLQKQICGQVSRIDIERY